MPTRLICELYHWGLFKARERREVFIEKKKKMGRPTDNPKTLNTRVRMSDIDIERLNFCCEITGKSKSEIIRMGIEKVYKDLKRK